MKKIKQASLEKDDEIEVYYKKLMKVEEDLRKCVEQSERATKNLENRINIERNNSLKLEEEKKKLKESIRVSEMDLENFKIAESTKKKEVQDLKKLCEEENKEVLKLNNKNQKLESFIKRLESRV